MGVTQQELDAAEVAKMVWVVSSAVMAEAERDFMAAAHLERTPLENLVESQYLMAVLEVLTNALVTAMITAQLLVALAVERLDGAAAVGTLEAAELRTRPVE